MTGKTDKALVQAAQNGCIDSFAALYKRYYSCMAALAYSVLAEKDLAEDIAQQTFAIACRDLNKLKSKEKFGSWLSGICRNTAKQFRSSRRKTVALDETIPAAGKTDDEHLTAMIRRSVWALRPFYREPIVLRYYNGLSYEQIASALGISQQAVNGRIFRAKQKIAKNLKRSGITRGEL